MEEKELLDNLRYKIENNEEITIKELLEIKEHDDEIGSSWWIVIILLLAFAGNNFKYKGDEKICMETIMDTTTQQEI